jgi:hypothetical protein
MGRQPLRPEQSIRRLREAELLRRLGMPIEEELKGFVGKGYQTEEKRNPRQGQFRQPPRSSLRADGDPVAIEESNPFDGTQDSIPRVSPGSNPEGTRRVDLSPARGFDDSSRLHQLIEL